MTDTFGDPENDEENNRPVTVNRDQLRKLEKQAKEGKKASAELDGLKKEMAFIRAGVPTDSKLGALFVKGYDGEATAEAIQEAWSELSGQPSGGQPSPEDQELAAMQGGQDLTAGPGAIAPDKLAERNQKLSALSQTDPRYDEKFAQIMDEYGGQMGHLVG